MATARFFEWFQLGALACWALLGLTRALLLRARGVRVLVADWQRTPWQMAGDTIGFACLLAWAYEIVAYGWPLAFHIGPVVLARIVVQSLATKTLGAIVVCIGVSLYAIALHDLGASWRMGLDRAAPGPLAHLLQFRAFGTRRSGKNGAFSRASIFQRPNVVPNSA